MTSVFDLQGNVVKNTEKEGYINKVFLPTGTFTYGRNYQLHLPHNIKKTVKLPADSKHWKIGDVITYQIPDNIYLNSDESNKDVYFFINKHGNKDGNKVTANSIPSTEQIKSLAKDDIPKFEKDIKERIIEINKIFHNSSPEEKERVKEEQKKKNKYLENVWIEIDEGKVELQRISFKILDSEIMNLTDTEKLINEVIDKVAKKNKNSKPKWISCEKDCEKSLSGQIKKEINSTAFMLRVLSNSVIDTTAEKEGERGSLPLKFSLQKKANLSGVWENDHKYFKLKKLDPERESRLIMGFGPSASGKTYWAKNVIKLMIQAEANAFPRSFLSIDGGLVRTYSYVYQDIIKALKNHRNITGFKNLVSTGLYAVFHESLFAAGVVKKAIRKYLETQKSKKGKLPVSLYVPETLGKVTGRWEKKVEVITDLQQDDKWIGLYIWQGITEEEDKKWVKIFHKEYTKTPNSKPDIGAVGTTKSGEEREEPEGKKYNRAAYYRSRTNGYAALKTAPGARIEIHNTGKQIGKMYKSVVIEYPNNDEKYILEKINEKIFANTYNSLYVKRTWPTSGQHWPCSTCVVANEVNTSGGGFRVAKNRRFKNVKEEEKEEKEKEKIAKAEKRAFYLSDLPGAKILSSSINQEYIENMIKKTDDYAIEKIIVMAQERKKNVKKMSETNALDDIQSEVDASQIEKKQKKSELEYIYEKKKSELENIYEQKKSELEDILEKVENENTQRPDSNPSSPIQPPDLVNTTTLANTTTASILPNPEPIDELPIGPPGRTSPPIPPLPILPPDLAIPPPSPPLSTS